MTDLIIQHHVHDFAAWKEVFDGDQLNRERHGSTGHTLLRSEADPNNVVVIVHFPSRSEAESFVSDPALKAAMQQAGVEGKPSTMFDEEVEVVTYGVPVG